MRLTQFAIFTNFEISTRLKTAGYLGIGNLILDKTKPDTSEILGLGVAVSTIFDFRTSGIRILATGRLKGVFLFANSM